MGLKKNILYSSILTTSNYIFPLIVYPYVSRVLGVTNIGICNFVDSIIHYFILFSMMGVTIMGTREIAANKHNDRTLENKYSSILALNVITTIIALVGLIAATFIVPQLWNNREMMFYGGIKLISNFFLIEWFYKGIEDFKYITKRTIFVKCVYVLSIFIFIQKKEDYPTYYLLTCLMVSINAIINFVHAKKFVHFNIKSVSITSIIKPFFTLGSYILITSMCTTFNVTYLGFITNDTQVGYYTTATKIYTILLALFTGVTSVIMPRMSALLAEHKENEYKNLLNKSTNILFAFSIPIIIFTIIFANQIILLLSGPGYQGAVIPMQIVMPLMLIIGYEQIIVVQGLIPLKKDKSVMINSTAGAIVSISLNILLVSQFKSVGSAIVWISSESVILILSQLALYRNIKIGFPIKYFIKNILCYTPLLIMLYFIHQLLNLNNFNYLVALMIGGSVIVLYLIIVQIYIIKNPLLANILKPIIRKIK